MRKKILVIRYHAFGDLMICLPYLNALRQQHPNAQIDLLTARISQNIPVELSLFDQVIGVRGAKRGKLLMVWSIWQLPRLIAKRYTHIIDLQSDRKSKLMQFFLRFKIEPIFEKFTPVFSGFRYQKALQLAGFSIEPNFNITLKKPALGWHLLKNAGWQTHEKLIVLNPAGFFETRNWPLQNYLDLIELLHKKYAFEFKILLLGDQRIEKKGAIISAAFPDLVINLINQTSQAEVFSVLSSVDLIVSEDSGLGHLAWIQGIKTLFLFGSTRADWTAPPYEHLINLTSTDLKCGNCMQATCQHGDVRCLTRYTPSFVLSKMEQLMDWQTNEKCK